MPDVAFVNGRFLPWKDATVSIDDRGFQFGDGVYEVVRTYQGQPFELEAHLDRVEERAERLVGPERLSVLYNQENRGFAAAVNRATGRE